ncbi:hypothetical protein FE392_08530 [Xenorhabdus sp. 12]|uniref:Transposase n=1 Tax=Xenorhabdus santafensis TaxID=2582833 RepID=A0ABU4S9E6_9GAMM|nr:hypothetical protein [Xenorhabdus sp. 12]
MQLAIKVYNQGANLAKICQKFSNKLLIMVRSAFIELMHQVKCPAIGSPYEGCEFMRIVINIIMNLIPVITQRS